MTQPKSDDAVAHFSGYAEQFDAYYHHRDEFAERLKIWHELLDTYSVPGGFSIDMGCGTGVFSLYLAEKGGRVVGVDGAPGMVAFCNRQRDERGLTNVRFFEARLPDVDEQGLLGADLLISSSVIEYVDDLDSCLALFVRLVKPGGTVILSMPNRVSISRTYERVKYRLTGEPKIYQHIRHFTSPAQLQRRTRQLGLSLLEARHYTHYTRAAKLARALRLPLPLSEDLFVAVFRRA
jgi:2-polyprenyl-3-methyl-5-hydroxy-6-metoxy-1,4-benzoquinol methylase